LSICAIRKQYHLINLIAHNMEMFHLLK